MEDLTQAVLEPLVAGRTAPDGIRTIVTNLLWRWQMHGPLLGAMDDIAERDPELGGFWASISDRIVGKLAALIEAERQRCRAPDGPSAHDIAWALTHLYWRVGHQLSLGRASAGVEDPIETLTAITMRTIYGEL